MNLNVQNFTPAFVLHTRPYRETSLLVEFFTYDAGRVSAVARGVKRKRSQLAGILMPFVPLGITFKGKTELVTLYRAEATAAAYYLQGPALFGGLYINELLLRLLPKHDAHTKLYEHYRNILYELALPPTQPTQSPQAPQPTPNNSWHQRRTLCLFEKHLLQEIGYGLELKKTAVGLTIVRDGYYTFEVGAGIIGVGARSPRPIERSPRPKSSWTAQEEQSMISTTIVMPAANYLSGESLLALQAGNIMTMADLAAAESVLSQVFYFLLGDKYLQCRKMLCRCF